MFPKPVLCNRWFCLVLLVAAIPALGPAKQAGHPAGQGGAGKKTTTPAGLAAPQSKHYPILLIASGTEPFWSVRIGMKGAERLERVGYPPITLEPGEIAPDDSGTAWLYHAKDTGTNADVAVKLSREACSDGTSDTKYSFKAVVTHAQIGELKGCAKIAAEQFPEFKQKNLDDDDPDKKKVVPPAITGFKPPVEIAYLDPAKKLMVARGEAAKLVATDGYQQSFSHDGRRMLYTKNLQENERIISIYEVATGRSTELLRGTVASAYFSPNDADIAFLKQNGRDWQVWTMPAGAPDKAGQLGAGSVSALHGWLDVHTVLASDASKLYFLKTDGPPSSVAIAEVYGQFTAGSTNAIRVNPANPDLLLVSAMTPTARPGMVKDPGTKMGSALFLYELKSKRQVVVTPPNILAQDGDWSRDGIQIFFTDAANPKAPSICRIFWDGSGFKRQRAGSDLVVGQ
jgi:uncharacterized membrane protein